MPTCHISTCHDDKSVKMLHAHTPFMTNLINIKHPAMFPVLEWLYCSGQIENEEEWHRGTRKNYFFLTKPANISGFVFPIKISWKKIHWDKKLKSTWKQELAGVHVNFIKHINNVCHIFHLTLNFENRQHFQGGNVYAVTASLLPQAKSQAEAYQSPFRVWLDRPPIRHPWLPEQKV